MYISQSTYEMLNEFLRLNFQMNSFCDNIAYNLGFQKMVGTEQIFHEKFAHQFPVFADTISTAMLQLEARPIRKSLNEDVKEYDNYVDMFSDLKQTVDKYRKDILKLIEVAELNSDVEIKIIAEKFLEDFMKYVDQVNLWYKKSKEYGDDVERFDHDFHSFTFI
nr:MAG TPA: Neutrophile activating protein [Bacteriophage sp.]